jgi:hypothetical protein
MKIKHYPADVAAEAIHILGRATADTIDAVRAVLTWDSTLTAADVAEADWAAERTHKERETMTITTDFAKGKVNHD